MYINEFELELICVLRHMQRYFSYICDGTDVYIDAFTKQSKIKKVSRGYSR